MSTMHEDGKTLHGDGWVTPQDFLEQDIVEGLLPCMKGATPIELPTLTTVDSEDVDNSLARASSGRTLRSAPSASGGVSGDAGDVGGRPLAVQIGGDHGETEGVSVSDTLVMGGE